MRKYIPLFDLNIITYSAILILVYAIAVSNIDPRLIVLLLLLFPSVVYFANIVYMLLWDEYVITSCDFSLMCNFSLTPWVLMMSI